MKNVINFYIFTAIFFFQIGAWSKTKTSDWTLEIIPLGWQYRYEDLADQTRAQRSYQHYFLALQKQSIRVGLEMNQAKSETGNSSARVSEKIQDKLASVGYQFLNKSWDDSTNSSVSILATGLFGMTNSEVETTLLGVSQTDSSADEMVWGFGFNGRLAHKFFVAEAFGQVLNSPNYTPKEVLTWGLRLGLQLKF